MLTRTVLVDLRSAFETVDHSLLLAKLNHFGIDQSELEWFCDYYKNRVQIVNFQNVLSPPHYLTFGLLQDFILRPLFRNHPQRYMNRKFS